MMVKPSHVSVQAVQRAFVILAILPLHPRDGRRRGLCAVGAIRQEKEVLCHE